MLQCLFLKLSGDNNSTCMNPTTSRSHGICNVRVTIFFVSVSFDCKSTKDKFMFLSNFEYFYSKHFTTNYRFLTVIIKV